MDISTSIYLKLLSRKFSVQRVDDILGSGERFYLGVGAIISIHASGKILVQGNLKPKYSAWAYQSLRRILLPNTKWQLG